MIVWKISNGPACMDNVTHTIVGVALSQAGLKRFFPSDRGAAAYATWLLILGANGPDIDVFAAIGGHGARYLEVHRGASHSFVGAPVIAITAAAIIWLFHRQFKKDRPFPWPAAFLLALAGVASHLLLDYLTPYGTRLLWPFSDARLAWDVFPVVDLWLTPTILAV